VERVPLAIATTKAMWLKRALDLALGLALAPFVLLVLAPVCLLVTLDGGSPIYRHLRLGRGGRTFYCYKIRTMVPDADAQLKALLDSNHLAREEWSEQYKLKKDPRVTGLGSFLRKTSLDELPQLWNVLKGHAPSLLMSWNVMASVPPRIWLVLRASAGCGKSAAAATSAMRSA